jgi:hypothetical protein
VEGTVDKKVRNQIKELTPAAGNTTKSLTVKLASRRILIAAESIEGLGSD